MNNIKLFFTPITFESKQKTWSQTISETCDKCFYFGQRKIRVLHNQETEFFQDNPPFQNSVTIAIKIALFCTLIIPTVCLIGKICFRPTLCFPIAPPSEALLFHKLFGINLRLNKLNNHGLTTDDIQEANKLYEKIKNIPQHARSQEFAQFLKYEDIEKLFSSTWLNDECINHYLQFLLRNNEKSCRLSSLCIKRLLSTKKPYANLQTHDDHKITKLFDTQEKIFIPLHVHNNHWTLVVADLKQKKLYYYDSLSYSPPRDQITNIRKYLQKIATEEAVTPCNFELKQEPCPQQKNLSDCGVFVLMAASHISENRPLTYSQEDVPYIRLKTLLSLAAPLLQR